MKYRITPMPQESFQPYELTLTVESQEEAKALHDVVACNLAESSPFIGNVYEAIRNPIRPCSGNVPIKYPE